jgi:hypothetical protein
MPWVRIDENALDHPKISALSDGAFRLWVQGLAYCQKFLTDGFINALSIRGLKAYSAKRRLALITAALWDEATTGVYVHDYLAWNDSKAQVIAARERGRERIKKLRGQSGNGVTPGVTPLQGQTANVLGGVPCSAVQEEESSLGKKVAQKFQEPTEARSKRPIFSGERFAVFEWMLDDLRKMLGKHFDDFDLHEWFYTLDARAKTGDFVIPQRDGGKWLQEQTLIEAERRGLTMAVTVRGAGKTAGNLASAARFLARTEPR